MSFSLCKIKTLILCSGILISSFTAVNAATVDPQKTSRKKTIEIDKIIGSFEAKGKKFYDPLVQAEIKDAIDQKYILVPLQEIKRDDWAERNTQARRNVQKTSGYDEALLRRVAAEDAEKKFPMDALKSEITVDYIKGKKGFQAKGKLYEISTAEGSIKVGNSRVYFADMSKVTRSRFDKKTNDQVKQEYVDSVLNKKRQEIAKLQKKECDRIAREQIKINLKNGYLFLNGKWVTVESYADSKINTIAKLQKKNDDEIAKRKEEAEQKAREEEVKQAELRKKEASAAASAPAAGNTQNVNTGKSDIELAREKLLSELEQKQKNIQTSYSGIDAFQGYANAGVWGLQTSEVRQALNIDAASAGVNQDVILNFPEESNIAKVVLHYFDATFRMVETNYKDMTEEQFADFHGKLREQFGLSKTEEASKDDLFKLIQENKITPDKLPVILDPSKDESGAGFAVPKMIDPKAYVFVWDGMMSRGVLAFAHNVEKKKYENIKIFRVSMPLRWEEKQRQKREAEAAEVTGQPDK